MNRVKQEPTAKASSPLLDASAADWPALAHRELVSRIIASSSFSRSERLSSFLTYICDMTLKGREAELNEQRIGHAFIVSSQKKRREGSRVKEPQKCRVIMPTGYL